MNEGSSASVDPVYDETLVDDGAVETDAQRIDKGTLVGRYVVPTRIGAGAMDEAFAAYDPERDRKVALKLLKPHADEGEEACTRLLREAQALARLGHPNVVTIHDVGDSTAELRADIESRQAARRKQE